MLFNKATDQTGIMISRFSTREGAHVGKHAIGIVNRAINASRVTNPTPTLLTE